MKSASETESLVRDSFINVAVPSDDIIAHECDECFELFDHFHGHVWSDVSDELINSHFDSLPLFSDNAKQYFYPAYLIYSIHHPESSVTEFLLYSLSSDHRHEPDSGFSASQIQAILAFLDYQDVSLESFHSEILQARRYWSQKAEQDAAANP